MNMARNMPPVSRFFLFISLIFCSYFSFAQNGDVKLNAKIDAANITVGDQAHIFIEAQYNQMKGKLQWAEIPDTFNHLEVVEKGKIDTLKQGDLVTLKQRLSVTGFDSGSFVVPSFLFSAIPNSGSSYTVATDSFQLLVQTVAVDTTKGYKPIKGIIMVKSSWKDYIWLIIGGIVFLVLLIFIVQYFIRNRKTPAPEIKPAAPLETLQEKYNRLLTELDQKQLWQNNQVKEYYVQLTDILRDYIEKRFQTPAMELTTDELLYKAALRSDMQPYQGMLSNTLRMADLAKFAKAQPLPQEHMQAMESVREFVNTTKLVITETTTK